MAKWLGVEITGATVRVAMVRSAYRRVAIEALREERIDDHGSLAAAVQAACHGLRAEAYATHLSGGRSFLRRVDLPAAAQKELSSVLGFEVEATLPFELDDAVMDHRVLKSLPGIDPPGMLPILAGVAYTHEVRARIEAVRQGAGHEPSRVSVGPLALTSLAQVAPELAGAEPIALLDLGHDHADVLVMQGGEPRFARSLSRGIVGLPAGAEALSRELRQTLSAWRMQGGAPIGAMYIVGSGHETPGLGHFVYRELGIELRALPKLALEGNESDLLRVPRFAKAIALALSHGRRNVDLNLRQGPLETQQSFRFLRDKTPLLAGLAAAIFVSFGFSIFAEMRALETERIMLEDQLAHASKVHFGQETRDPEEAEKMLDDAISGKSDDPIPDIDAFAVLVEISERIPKEITHDIAEFDFNRHAVVMKGIVPTIDDAHTVSKQLAEHECFKEVNIARTTQLKGQDKQKYALEFEVSCGKSKKKKKKKGKSSTSKGGKK
jgi:general secretion pathway protein L